MKKLYSIFIILIFLLIGCKSNDSKKVDATTTDFTNTLKQSSIFSNIKFISQCKFKMHLSGNLVIDNSHAYISSWDNKFIIMNLSNPSNPEFVIKTNIVVPGSSGSLFSIFDKKGKYAYFSFYTDRHSTGSNGIVIVNVADPKKPIIKGYCYTPLIPGGVLSSSRNYIYALQTQDGQPVGTGMCIIDIKNKSKPKLASYYKINEKDMIAGDWVDDIYNKGNLVYLANNKNGLRIFDVRNPKMPKQISKLPELGGGAHIGSLASIDNYIYACYAGGPYGIRIINVKNPYKPKEVNFFEVLPKGVYNIIIKKPNAYILDSNETFRMFNITNPVKPKEIGFYKLPERCDNFAIWKDYIFVLNHDYGLIILKREI